MKDDGSYSFHIGEAREQILKAAFKKADYSMEGDQLKRLVTETAKISGSAVKDLAT